MAILLASCGLMLAISTIGTQAKERQQFHLDDGISPEKAKQIFDIAKPLIATRLHDDLEDMTYSISQFESQWIIHVCPTSLQYVPGGETKFVFSNEGEFCFMSGGM